MRRFFCFFVLLLYARLEHLFFRLRQALVAADDSQPFGEEGDLAQTATQGVEIEVALREDFGRGQEGDLRAAVLVEGLVEGLVARICVGTAVLERS